MSPFSLIKSGVEIIFLHLYAGFSFLDMGNVRLPCFLKLVMTNPSQGNMSNSDFCIKAVY